MTDMAARPPALATREIAPLTGLRGYAALVVVLYHFGQPPTDLGVPSHFHIPKGYMAVDCFFILSGFVLAYNYARDFAVFRPDTYGGFLVRRFARIYPAYIGIAALYMLKLIVNVSDDHAIQRFTATDYVGNLLIATGWGFNIKPIIGVTWSVSAEIVCYIVFPLLLWLAAFPRRSFPVVGLFFVVFGYLCIWWNDAGAKGWLDVVESGSVLPTLRAFSGFTIGLMLYDLFNRTAHGERVSDVLTLGSTGFLVIGCLLGSDALAIVALTGLVLGLALDGPLAHALYGNPIATYLGRVSYSLYLVHAMMIAITFRQLAKYNATPFELRAYIIGLIAYVGVNLLLATSSYEILELRGKRLVMNCFERGVAFYHGRLRRSTVGEA